MATLRNYHWLGCGDDLKNRAGDRWLMTSLLIHTKDSARLEGDEEEDAGEIK